MAINYDYMCQNCGGIEVHFVKYDDRDKEQPCESCDGVAVRGYYTAPQVRTPKTSRTFLDGGRNDGYKEEGVAAKLDAEAMNHRRDSEKYNELKAEAKTRRLLNDNPGARPNRYKFTKAKKEVKKND